MPSKRSGTTAPRSQEGCLCDCQLLRYVFGEPYAGEPAMGRYDHVIEWFKKRHDTLIDDFEPLQAGSRRVMEFDGSEWRDITPKIIRETEAGLRRWNSSSGSTISATNTRPNSICLPVSKKRLLPVSKRRLLPVSKRNLLPQSKRKLPDFPQLLRSLFPRNGPPTAGQ